MDSQAKVASKFSLETSHSRSEEKLYHQKSTATINHGGQKRTQQGEGGIPALRRHSALQQVLLMLCLIPAFTWSVAFTDQLYQKIILRLYGFGCRARDGEQVWEIMVEEKLKKSVSLKRNHSSARDENPASQSSPVTGITQFLLVNRSLHQHHLYPTRTASADHCQQATEL